MRLNASQLSTIRSRPQLARLHMSIFEPRAIMQCRVNNGSIAKGARTIAYDTVTLGSYVAVEAGMTLLVGSTAGASDIGRVRIRSATSGAFTISENNNIRWQDNQYLTVLRYWEIWPIFPRVIHDPNNVENVLFYKDYDIAYTDQNAVLGTFICAGPHRAAFLEGGQAREWYTSSGTSNLRGSTLTYEWAFEGGTPTGSTSANPGYVTYSAPGHYVTRLIVRGSGGEEDTTYRYVSIYDRPENGTSTPILNWTMAELTGSRDEGGYRAEFTVHETLPIDDNAVVVLFYDVDYAGTPGAMGGNAQNASDIFFVGNVERGSITYDYAHNTVSFEASSVTKTMKNAVGFAISAGSKASPTTWYEIADLDARRALYHFLRWHSTALYLADFRFIGTDYKLQYFDSDRESIYDAIDNLMRGTLLGNVCADRQGAIFAEVGPVVYTNPTGSFTSIMSIGREDWRNAPVLEKRVQDEYSYVELGGVVYSGVGTGTFNAYLTCAPGPAPSFRGKIEHIEGLAIGGQTHINQIAGNLFANRNIRYPSVALDLAGLYTNLDIAPYEAVTIHLNPSDTPENKNIDLLAHPNDITWTYDPLNGVLLPSTTFQTLESGIPGETIVIPIAPDEVDGGGAGNKVGPIQLPDFPIITIPPMLGELLGSRPFIFLQGDSVQTIVNSGDEVSFANRTLLLQSTTTGPVYFGASDAGITIVQGGYYLIIGTAVALPQSGAVGDQTFARLILDGFPQYGYEAGAVNKTSAVESFNESLTFFSVVSGAGIVKMNISKNYPGWAYVNYPSLFVMRI